MLNQPVRRHCRGLSSSGRSHRCQELFYLLLQPPGIAALPVGEGENRLGGRRGGGGAFRNASDIAADLLCALGRLLDVTGDFLGGRPLFLDGRRDTGGNLPDLVNDGGDVLDGADGVPGLLLHRGDLLADLAGGPGGLVSQAFDFVGHHGEAFSGLSGPCRLDGGVESQKIGLAGDVVDQFHNLANAAGGNGKLLHQLIGLRRFPPRRC